MDILQYNYNVINDYMESHDFIVSTRPGSKDCSMVKVSTLCALKLQRTVMDLWCKLGLVNALVVRYGIGYEVKQAM